ncbi:hypothetical protein RB595_007375 [Gaeumannomyces hyphopodioides]
MSFLEDPRLRQRWNQISHNAEGAAENAAAGIWKFQHRYIAPCLANVCNSLDACTGVCLGGDREERARRARERERGARRTRAEYSFDFYDDWDDDDDALAGYGYYDYHGDGGGGAGSGSGGGGGGGGGILGTDWDRLLAGTGASSRSRHGGAGAAGAGGDVVDQPRRKGTMNYGTRRKTSVQEDPTVIPSTSTFGFLGRLPFKIGGTLRYKPSAANLQDHPGAVHHHHSSAGERRPLLGGGDDDEDAGAEYHGGGRDGEVIFQRSRSGKEVDDDDEYYDRHGHRQRGAGGEGIYNPKTRKRSSTTGSGATSDSYRSRGDLFPSDGEGEEDAVPLDDEFAVALDRVTTDDRSSSIGGGAGRTRSVRKGKRRANSMGNSSRGGGGGSYNPAIISRSVSRTTIASMATTASSTQAMASPSVMRRPSSPSGSAPGMEETRQHLEDKENPVERHGPATPLAHQSPRSPEVHFDDIPEPPPFLPRDDDGSLGQIVGGTMEVETPDPSATNSDVTAVAPAAPTAGPETAAPDRTSDQEFFPAMLPNFR